MNNYYIKKSIKRYLFAIIFAIMFCMSYSYAEPLSMSYKSGFDVVEADGRQIFTMYNDSGDLRMKDNMKQSAVIVASRNENGENTVNKSYEKNDNNVVNKVMPNYDKYCYSVADLMCFSSDDLSLLLKELIEKYNETKNTMTFDTYNHVWSNHFLLSNIKELQYMLSDKYKNEVYDREFINNYNNHDKLTQKIDMYIKSTASDIRFLKEKFWEYDTLNRDFRIEAVSQDLKDSLYYDVAICCYEPVTIDRKIIDRIKQGDELRFYTTERSKMTNENYRSLIYLDEYEYQMAKNPKTNNFIQKIAKFFGGVIIENEKQKFLKFIDSNGRYFYLKCADKTEDCVLLNSLDVVVDKKVCYMVRVLKNARIYNFNLDYVALPRKLCGMPDIDFLNMNSEKCADTYKKEVTSLAKIEFIGNSVKYITFDKKGYVTALYYHTDDGDTEYSYNENETNESQYYYSRLYSVKFNEKNVKMYDILDSKNRKEKELKLDKKLVYDVFADLYDDAKNELIYVYNEDKMIKGFIKKIDTRYTDYYKKKFDTATKSEIDMVNHEPYDFEPYIEETLESQKEELDDYDY